MNTFHKKTQRLIIPRRQLYIYNLTVGYPAAINNLVINK